MLLLSNNLDLEGVGETISSVFIKNVDVFFSFSQLHTAMQQDRPTTSPMHSEEYRNSKAGPEKRHSRTVHSGPGSFAHTSNVCQRGRSS